MDYILHIDTSTDIGTVAVSGNGNLLTQVVNEEIRNHAGTINNMIAGALKNVNISIAHLSAIAVCAGPGSYTGLRIAMATAKGLCYAAGLPLILNDRLSLLAYTAIKKNKNTPRHIATILTAREKEYFIGIYNNEYSCDVAPIHVSEQELASILHGKENLYIITDVREELFYQLKVSFSGMGANIKLDANAWAELTYLQYNRHDFADLAASVPLYLKQVYTHKWLIINNLHHKTLILFIYFNSMLTFLLNI